MLPSGSRLGPYEIMSPLGAGGMGEVYRARDTRLNRDVAIKVLPEAFAADAERLARFRREAQVLASLNHPHIGAIHGLEESGGLEALVLELVEGETLAERIARGPLPLDDALEIGRQIARALEAAHERGIVHRDLKPANVKLTPAGEVKVLDFGLAKALAGDGSSPDVTASPTLTAGATQAGVIIGTAAYMSPEQARGRAADRRADIWAFGCVLYEMLTGRKAFEGETVSDTLAAVLTREPDWNALPAATPPSVRRVLRRCLDRDPRTRLHDVADARIEMDETVAPDVLPAAAPARRPAWLLAGSFVAGAALALVAFYFATRGAATSPASLKRFSLVGLNISLDNLTSIGLAPDGSKLVFRGRGEDGFERLYVRAFDSLQPLPLPGTEQGSYPFFSTDGRWVGFFSSGSLRKVSVSGGSPQTLCRVAGRPGGGAWLSDGTILFVGDIDTGVDRVSAEGGTPQAVLRLNRQKGESAVWTPWALPGGKAFLCVIRASDVGEATVVSLENGDRKVLARDAFMPIYVPTGHLLFRQGQGNTILAQPFDLARLATTGEAFPAVSGVATRISAQSKIFNVAEDGTLVYLPASTSTEKGVLLWVDRRGVETPVTEIPQPIDIPRLSPNGRQIAFRIPGTNCDVWIHDVARGATTRLTLAGDNHGVAWTPDGKSIAFSRAVGGKETLYAAPTAGGAALTQLPSPAGTGFIPDSWSPDGGSLICRSAGKDTGANLSLVPADTRSQPRQLIETSFDETQGAFSRDGRALAYVSNESGRTEVYVQPYPAMDSRIQISTAGGTEPVWSHDGKELFFRQGRKMMAVDVQTSPSFSAGRPRQLFEGEFLDGYGTPGYDVAADGRFLMIRGRSAAGIGDVNVVLNWFEELRRLERTERNK